jgi:hypothetical protein
MVNVFSKRKSADPKLCVRHEFKISNRKSFADSVFLKTNEVRIINLMFVKHQDFAAGKQCFPALLGQQLN